MPSLTQHTPPLKKILILASSGGGGLIQAANAKEQQIRSKYPNVRIIRRDILRDWTGKWMGGISIKLWNSAQKSGNITALKIFSIGVAISDFFFAPYVFYKALKTLFQEDIDHIIDTQPLCTGSIIKALRIFHWKKGRRVCLEKVLVDLPTPQATHYFRSIRKLSDSDRVYLKVTTILPFLKEGETSQQFWKKNCSLCETQVNYEPFYVRKSFCRYHKKPCLSVPISVRASIKNTEEGSLMKESVQRSCLEARWKDSEVEFVVQPKDLVFTILLGSQPAYSGSLNYVKNFIDLAREFPQVSGHLFIFCSNHVPNSSSLLKSVSNAVSEISDYPSSFSIVPLSFQTDEIIAPLFHRSDVTCTRSGGQTLMELMCVSPKQIWIHSESKKKKYLSEEELLEGIAGWEAANALYMVRKFGAKIVTPDSFMGHAREFFKLAASEAQGPSSLSAE